MVEPKGAHSRSRVGSPTAAEELEEGADAFQESVIRFHLAMTDAHMAAAGADSGAQQAALRRVFEELGAMRAELYVGSGAEDGQAPPPQRAVQEEMLADCERKAGEVMLNLLRRATSAVAPDPEAAPGLFYECVRLRQEAKVGRWSLMDDELLAWPSRALGVEKRSIDANPSLSLIKPSTGHIRMRIRPPTSTAASSSAGCRRRRTRRSRPWTPCAPCGGCSSARATAWRRTRTSMCVSLGRRGA